MPDQAKFNKMINFIRDIVFKNVHGNNLIYNICWEDPRCDREVMQINKDSKIVMISSAGCNALDYLLDNPKHVHCIDLNYRQNALVELKKALIQTNYEELYRFFGEGQYAKAELVFQDQLKEKLPAYAREFWEKKISYFVGNGAKKSFYYRGTSGTLAWLFIGYLKTRKKLYEKVMRLMNSSNLEEQTYWYNQIEPKLFNKAVKWTISRHFALALAGVPRAQRKLISEEYPGGVPGFMVDCVRHVFTKIEIKDNYFWKVYVEGKYSKECCPNYLKEENYDLLKSRVDRLTTHTTSLSAFLKDHPGTYSNYVLLDHQDWLAAHDIPALEEEWELILKNSKPGTIILMRSAATRIDFFPDFVKEKVDWIPQADLSELHKKDRVGTYGSVYVGTVK